LSVEDQVVYQAMVNLIAERHRAQAGRHHLVASFGHVYAGRTSKTFYRDWRRCRREYMRRARGAFGQGLKYTATFDLAACYDTINHGVVDYFLEKLGFDHGFRAFFRQLLRTWTVGDGGGISLDVGIPQGPLGSGLVAELVLGNFDIGFEPDVRTLKYLRYVDDIRLFGLSEDHLRRHVWELENTAKRLGLHPNAAKVDIHEVTDIFGELKSISVPEEDFGYGANVDQVRLRRRIVQLTPRFDVRNETRFKYVLPMAKPDARLTKRLLKVLARRPDLFVPITSYVRKHRRLPRKCGEDLLQLIHADQLRPFVRATLMQAVSGRLPSRQEAALTKSAKLLLISEAPPDLKIACAKRLLQQGVAGPRLAHQMVRNGPWWIRAELTRCLNNEGLSLRQLAGVLSLQVCDPSQEVAIAAANQFTNFKLWPNARLDRLNPAAARILRRTLALPANCARCGVHQALSNLLEDNKIPRLSWRRSFRKDYRWMEQQSIECERQARSNPTAFVNALDVFLDALLDKLHKRDRTLGSYQPGNIGGILASTRLRAAYPRTFSLIRDVHNQRGHSRYSHAVNRRTGTKTRSIRWEFVTKVKKDLRRVLNELSGVL
jgi:hypothetical protein